MSPGFYWSPPTGCIRVSKTCSSSCAQTTAFGHVTKWKRRYNTFFFKVPTTTIFHMSHNSICQHMPVPLHYPPLLLVSRTPTPAYLYLCPQVRVYLYTGNAFASVTGDVTMHATATVPLQLGVRPLGKVSIFYILYVYFDTNLCFYYIYIFHWRNM
jgi:hypothetical protein